MTKTDIVRQLVKKMPGAPARTLARRLRNDHPEVFASIESARDLVRAALGVHGKPSIKGAVNPRPPRKSGAQPQFPKSSAEPWKPYVLPSGCTVLSLSDLHVPYHDRKAIETAVRAVKKRHKIDVLLLNGDYGDFYQISRFVKSPLRRKLSHELSVQRDGLEWLANEFKRQLKVFKKGNHDVRWDHWVWEHAPELADCEHMRLETILGLDKLGFKLVDDEPVMAGKLPIFHGHELGKGNQSPVNPARGAFMRTLHSVLVAHSHRTSSHGESNLWHKEMMTWSQGCLCNLNPEYARVNKMNQGFAVVEVAKDSTYNVLNYRIGADYAVRQS